MNDFTKEEMGYMSDILKIHINDYPTLTSRDQDFLIKIQSMIDNYSEHAHIWNRLTMLSGKDYDFCEGCMSVRRIR